MGQSQAHGQDLEQELTRIVQAIEFAGSADVVFAGQRSAPVPDTESSTVTRLQSLLYQYCYCRRFGDAAPEVPAAEISYEAFLGGLAASNRSQDRWQSGWQITQVLASGQIVARRYAITRLMWPGEFMSHSGPGVPPQPGTPISLFVQAGSSTLQPGFYFAFGETVADWQDQEGIVRFYWNVRSSAAAVLMDRLTGALNRFQIPFQFKCLSNPAAYPRTDAAILYVARRLFRITAQVLTDLCPAFTEVLLPSVPLFSKHLLPGLGFAEDPGNGESFGMNRCRLLAEAVWRVHANGESGASARVAAVREVFGENGLAFGAPYLNPGSRDDYPFPVPS